MARSSEQEPARAHVAGLPKELKAGNLRHEAGQEAEDAGAKPGAIQ